MQNHSRKHERVHLWLCSKKSQELDPAIAPSYTDDDDDDDDDADNDDNSDDDGDNFDIYPRLQDILMYFDMKEPKQEAQCLHL